jgi:hypothetical protein
MVRECLTVWDGVQGCMRRVFGKTVKIMVGSSGASLQGVGMCNNSWLCPHCAARRALERAEEVTQAVDKWCLSGGIVVMGTFTIRHQIECALVDTIKELKSAFGQFVNSWHYRDMKDLLGVVGLVQSLEITFSWDNGWHPHFHCLFFMNNPVGRDMNQFISTMLHDFRIMWCKEFKDERYKPDYSKGVFCKRVVDSRKAAEYVNATWDAGKEVSLSMFKDGSLSSITFWHMLDFYNFDDSRTSSWLMRIIEYAKATKGVRQLYWSPGMRKRLGVVKVKFENLEQVKLVGEISSDNFALLSRFHLVDAMLSAVGSDPRMFVIGSFLNRAHQLIMSQYPRSCVALGIILETG